MPPKPPKLELAEIHAQQRQLRLREAQVLARLADDTAQSPVAPRPGWPMHRLPECRAT